MLLPKWVIQEYCLVVAPHFEVKINTFINIGVGEQGELCDGIFLLQPKLFGDESLKRTSKICFHNLDMTDDMLIKCLPFLCWNPEFLVLRFTNRVRFKFTQILILDLELSNVSCILSIFGIPIGSDLTGIFKLKNWIENRLLRQADRKGLHAVVIDQLHFLQTDRTIKNHIVIESLLHLL